MRRDTPDVAFVAPYPPAGIRHGGHSGVASYTANLATALAAEGVRVAVVAPFLPEPTDRGQRAEPDDFTDGDVVVRRRFPLGANALPRAAAAVAAVGGPLVHLQWEMFLYGGAGALRGLVPSLYGLRQSPSPLVTTMHQVLDPATIDRTTTSLHRVGVPAPLARVGIGTVQRAIAAASDVTVVHEQAFRRVVPGATVINHGIERPPSIDRVAARRRLELDPFGRRLVVLCFGFLAPYKGLELVADAAALAGPDVQIVFAGGEHPRMHGDSYSGELSTRGNGRPRFTGWVPDDDVADWFAAADVALFSYPKPFAASGALALALAHGTPVLLSPAMARCVGAPSTLLAPMQPPALAGQLDALAANPDRLTELAEWTAVLRAEREWPTVARRHIAVYADVLEGVHDDPAGRGLRAA
jgi:glycosyltransferase involved in cell wall biosynthesis